MIYITGDTHGDFSRFKLPALKKLKKNDSLIICGDFGFIWNGGKEESSILKKIGKLKYNVLFVEGSHENYDLLEQYEVSEWCGGKTRVISGKLRQLMRGQIYNIDGETVFSFGGGQRDDGIELTEEASWWQRELPTEDEMNEGLRNLNLHGNKADYIVTYEPPSKIRNFLDLTGNDHNHLNTYLNGIFEKSVFKGWFFGKLHINKFIPPKYHALYDDIISASEITGGNSNGRNQI